MDTILVTEDEPSFLFICQQMLKRKYEVVCASNGIEAVEKYKEVKPDLVLMDIRLPFKNGDAAIKEIREFDPDAKIVAMTVYDYGEDELGVEILRKRFTRDELLAVVERNLSN